MKRISRNGLRLVRPRERPARYFGRRDRSTDHRARGRSRAPFLAAAWPARGRISRDNSRKRSRAARSAPRETARRADHRRRPARRRRPRRLSRRYAHRAIAAPGALPHRARRAARPARRLRRRRRRLPDQAVRIRGAGRASAHALRQARAGTDCRPRWDSSDSIPRRTPRRSASAIAKLTPTEFRLLARSPRRRGDAVRRRQLVRDRVAARRHRPRQHARCVHRAPADASSQRFRMRRRSPRCTASATRCDDASSCRFGSFAARLLLAVVGAVAGALAIDGGRLQPAARARLDGRDEPRFARARPWRRSLLSRRRRKALSCRQAPDEGRWTSPVWVFAGDDGAETPRVDAGRSRQPPHPWRAARSARLGSTKRCACTPCRWSTAMHESAPSSRGCRSMPYERTARIASPPRSLGLPASCRRRHAPHALVRARKALRPVPG